MDWNKVTGFFSEWDFCVIEKVVNSFQQPVSVLEIGSLYGKSSLAFASLKNVKSLHCVDAWSIKEHMPDYVDPNIVYENFLQNTKDIEKITHEKIKHIEPMQFKNYDDYDIVFYDACHSFESTLNAIEYWKDKSKYIILDDCYMKEVKQAIEVSGLLFNYNNFSKMAYTKCFS